METIFKYNDEPVRFKSEDGVYWFSGLDICNNLEYVDHKSALKKLDPDEKMMGKLKDEKGQNRKAWLVNTSGVYHLIVRSTKPEAKKFRRWVTMEVLPRIQQLGSYTSEQERERNEILLRITTEVDSLTERLEEITEEGKEIRKKINVKNAELHFYIKMDPNQLRIDFNDGDDE